MMDRINAFGWLLNALDAATLYGSGEAGLMDYPTFVASEFNTPYEIPS